MKELAIQLAQDHLAQLESERGRVQGRLESNSGLLGRWRMPSEERNHLMTLDKMLFQATKAQIAILNNLYEPEQEHRLEPLLRTIYGSGGVATTAAGVWWATFRGWALLRIQYAPYTAEQLHWRKRFLQLDSPFPLGVKKLMFCSAMSIVFYYYLNPPANGKGQPMWT